ncbi:MAG: hypothetical protein AAGK00_01680 [Pseudomonadota bacterium]
MLPSHFLTVVLMRNDPRPGKRRLRGYAIAKISLLLLFGLYVPIAIIGGARGGEFFPVFNWSLFSSVRNPTVRLEIEVSRIGDELFNPPVNFFELPDHFPAAKERDVRLIKGSRGYLALKRDKHEHAEIFLDRLEQRYFAIGKPVTYRLVAVAYDPVERYHSGEVIGKETISEHKFSGRP